MDNKQLDSYSILITSKYFESSNDFVNLICVSSKFKETTEKLRYNPIPITSMKLFPKIQTQYLYSDKDVKIEGIDNYEIWYKVTYDRYLKHKLENTKFHYIEYTGYSRYKYGYKIPKNITSLGDRCFFGAKKIISKNLPFSVTSLGNDCFSHCTSIKHINLTSSLRIIGKNCFSYCLSLKTINLPSFLTSLSDECFKGCKNLKSIDIPSTVSVFGKGCFNNCVSLKTINIPSLLTSFGTGCFYGCTQLQGLSTFSKQYFVQDT
ncbi:Leucine rich repeat protein [Entamoeba marina]